MENIIEVKSYSKIFLGHSSTNIKEYYIKSKLNLNTEIITYPFGTNRTRYQFPEMFKYKLLKIDKNDADYKYYKLIVERNSKPNCSKTAKYFWSPGWKFNLHISFIPKYNINLNFISKEEIIFNLPNNYADIELKIPDKYCKPNIGIVIPIYNRNQYLKKCLESLSKTNLKNSILVLIDESLTKDVDKDKKKTNQLVKEYLNDTVILIKIYKKKHGNMFDSILHGFDLLYPLCDYLITLDSDTIHKKNWIIKLLETYKKTKLDFPNKNLLLSGFNTLTTNFHKVIEDKNHYIIKNSVGGCQLFFNKILYIKFLRFVFISHKWDTNLVVNLKNNNGIVIATKPSVIDHIGIISSGHRKDNNNLYDKAIDF